MSKSATKTEKTEALERLRQWYPKGSTVYTILRSVSRSGMSREIGILALGLDSDHKIAPNDPPTIVDFHPNHAVATVLGLRLGRDCVKMSGCGMDQGFAIAYELGRALYGDGQALKHRWI